MNGKLVKLAGMAIISIAVGSAAIAQQRPGRGGQGGGQGERQREGGGPREEGDRPRRPDPDQCFDRADANHDGNLSREEFTEWFTHRPPPPPPRDREGGDDRPPPPRD
jgi:hypothetical protein